MFRLDAGRTPFEPEDALAYAATISQLERVATSGDFYWNNSALPHTGRKLPT
jgi:hypothetical protein